MKASIFPLICLVVILSIALSSSLALGDEISNYFEANNVDGTLIVAKKDGTPIYMHNNARAKIRYSPASTFKILNTLIGLDSGAVQFKGSQFKWDGDDKGSAAWNRDHTLETAFRASCVWVYQDIARHVGRDRYVSDLQTLGYGNARIGDEVDQFWLNDELQISGIEQIEFLRQLHTVTLLYKNEHLAELKAMMHEEKTSSYSLYAKSGWSGPTLHIGWYVGYIETLTGVWLFAMNMDMEKLEQAPLRKELVIKSLKSLQLV
ncbi:MAG: beta-lactamase class D [Flavobacterium sp.]|jgi:beta-lactamase class D